MESSSYKSNEMNQEPVVLLYKFPVEDREPPPRLPPIPAYLEPFVPTYTPQEFPQQEMDEFAQEIALGQKVEPQDPVEEALFEDVPWESVKKAQAAYSRRDPTSKEDREKGIQVGEALLRSLKEWGQKLTGPKMCDHTDWQVELRLWEIAEAKKAWKQAKGA